MIEDCKTHELKILPEWLWDIKHNNKNFEIRKNDRNYSVGDILILREYEHISGKYTGDEIKAEILYILPLHYLPFFMEHADISDYVVMSIRVII